MNPLLAVLREPALMGRLDEEAWDSVIRMARLARLLSRLQPLAEGEGLWEVLPERARNNILGAQAWVTYHQRQVRRELKAVQKALEGLDAPLLLLKGAAYLEAALPPAAGRTLADLDLLVPKEALPPIEQTLVAAGWRSDLEDDYDQRYYRRWMHEIPPLKHPNRGVEVDLHHNLLALTGRYQVPVERLWEEARPLPGGKLWVLSPADMVIHSAVHLLVSDELRGGLKDLFDIHQLYHHFSAAEADFPRRLVARAAQLGLSRPLWYALQACRRLLGTPVEPSLQEEEAFDLPHPWQARLMIRLVEQVLTPRLPEAPPPTLAQELLYLRSHWLRMPLPLLTAHLARKAWRRMRGSDGHQEGKIP